MPPSPRWPTISTSRIIILAESRTRKFPIFRPVTRRALVSVLRPWQAQINIHHAAGRIRDGVAYEQYVIDNEIIGMAKRAVKGIHVNEDTLALKEVLEQGPGGSFIATPHTVHFMRDASLLPKVSDRSERSQWEELGSLDGMERPEEKPDGF